jgi:hypothetical protein
VDGIMNDEKFIVWLHIRSRTLGSFKKSFDGGGGTEKDGFPACLLGQPQEVGYTGHMDAFAKCTCYDSFGHETHSFLL